MGALRECLLRDAALTFVEDGQQVRIEQVLARLYPANRIPRSCETVIQLFTLLPRDSYYDCLSQIALVAQRQKRFDESKAAYEEILRERSGQVYGNVARNNYAVLLLDMGQPEEAPPVIEQVLAIAREQGGIALAEALRNKARAHGMLGDTAQERECLTEALPLLEQTYGPEFERTTAARERLAQLREQEVQEAQPLSP